jgi:hypothetical protein
VFERFTDRARRVLVLAQEEARLLNHSFIGTEHILLGLIAERDGLAAEALSRLDISLEAVREEVEETIGMDGTAPSGSPPFTPRAKKVLELSLRESLQLGHSYIGTEHMLLGLVREGEGVAATVLVSLGADLGRVREQVIQLMSGHQGKELVGARRGSGDRPPGLPILGQPKDLPWMGYGTEWVPPVWDRPSEGTVPAVFVVDALLNQNDVVALAVDHLEVYPNGFTICMSMRVNPHRIWDMVEMMHPIAPNRRLLVGVRFADGQSATSRDEKGFTPESHKDNDGIPIEPIVRTRGQQRVYGDWRGWAWVCPLPPDGPLELLVALEAAGLSEASVTVDGTAIREAAGRARVLWT